MHGFCIFSGLGVGGGRKRPQNTVFWGPKRIHGALRILAVFCPYSTESQNTQNTDRIRTMYSGGQNTPYSVRILCIPFWWTEYRILSKQQNTDRIRTEYGQNTVITKSPIVITNSTPPVITHRQREHVCEHVWACLACVCCGCVCGSGGVRQANAPFVETGCSHCLAYARSRRELGSRERLFPPSMPHSEPCEIR